jgi:KaiC/GvpD/RAD55 family RecA-like ATPase
MRAIGAAAVALAVHGWQVLPVGQDKRPVAALVPHGLADASADPSTVESWFDGAEYNLGLVIPPGHVVVDVDDPAALAALERQHGPLPPTREARTGGGGRHLWFRADGELIQRRLAPGVDTRVAGKGYVVAPPSVHASGRPYEWTSERDIAEAPAWLVAALAPDAVPDGSGTWNQANPSVSDAGEALARHYLATCEPAVSGQGGHEQTIRAAGVVVRGFALGEQAGLDLLREVYNPRCQPPWSEKELRHKAADAARGRGDPTWGSMLTAPAPARTPRRTLAERYGGLVSQGPQIPTGMRTLDRLTRGGPRVGKLVLLGGAPGACKTALATQLACTWALAGVPVTFLAFDEEADAVAIRIGQAGGQAREHLEAGVAHAVRAAAARAAGPLAALELVDGEDDGATIEDAAEALRARAGAGPAVLVVDSLQTAAIRTRAKESRREEIDARVGALKSAAKSGLLVVATTELARGSYRSKNSAEQIDDLAAAKESGGIEYAASMLLVLRSVPGTPDLVDVTVPKNRLGPERAPWRFRLDFDRATVAEVDRPEEVTPAQHFEQVRVAVLTAVRLAAEAGKPHTSGTAVAREVKGRKAEVLEALRELTAAGEIITALGGAIRPAKGVGSGNTGPARGGA